MTTVLLVVHVLITIALVIVVLIQQSEGGGLGIGGGSMGGILSHRATANVLTRTTAILATLFILTSLTLAFISSREGRESRKSIIDSSEPQQEAPVNNETQPSAPIAE